MILGSQGPGKIGHRQDSLTKHVSLNLFQDPPAPYGALAHPRVPYGAGLVYLTPISDHKDCYTKLMDNIDKQNWEAVYQTGHKYQNAPPVTFTQDIIKTLRQYNQDRGEGLYVGCGNGRNFIPLIKQELHLTGLDISQTAIVQLQQKALPLTPKLICADFNAFRSAQPFDYLISIQVFQHGDWNRVQQMFRHTFDLLRPGGLLFLRVKSTNMPTKDPHTIIETTALGGFTTHFISGKKQGQDIHYYAAAELKFLATEQQEILPPTEAIEQENNAIRRAHWQAIWRKS